MHIYARSMYRIVVYSTYMVHATDYTVAWAMFVYYFACIHWNGMHLSLSLDDYARHNWIFTTLKKRKSHENGNGLVFGTLVWVARFAYFRVVIGLWAHNIYVLVHRTCIYVHFLLLMFHIILISLALTYENLPFHFIPLFAFIFTCNAHIFACHSLELLKFLIHAVFFTQILTANFLHEDTTNAYASPNNSQ